MSQTVSGNAGRFLVHIPLTIVALITCGVILSWFQAPISGDNKIFFAAARQADHHGNFPLNVYRSWELKPLGHRIIIYGFYKTSTVFSRFSDKEHFERSVKITYGLTIALVTFVFVYGIRQLLQDNGFPLPWVFLGILLVFFSMSYLIRLQAEELSILFIMAAMPLALAKPRFANIMAGIPLAGLFTLKGITLLLGMEVLLVLYVLGTAHRSNLVWTGMGTAACLALILAVLVFIFPMELREMRNATLFQGSLEFDLKQFASMPWAFWHKFQFAPVLLPSVVLGWLVIPTLAWCKQWKALGILLGALTICGAIVVVQGLFFGYHYSVFVVPAIGILALVSIRASYFGESLTTGKLVFLGAWSLALILVLAAATAVDRKSTDVVPFEVIGYNLTAVFLAFTILLGWFAALIKFPNLRRSNLLVLALLCIALSGFFWARYQSPWCLFPAYGEVAEAERQVFGRFDAEYGLSRQDIILYLTGDGISAYYYGAPSQCRYFTLEAIKRANSNAGARDLQNRPVFQETMRCILSYQGKYLILTPEWNQLQQFPQVMNKIATEYELVDLWLETPRMAVYRKLPIPGG